MSCSTDLVFVCAILVQNTSVWQGWPSLCGSFVEIWKLYPWRKMKQGLFFPTGYSGWYYLWVTSYPTLEVVTPYPVFVEAEPVWLCECRCSGEAGEWLEGKPAERGREQTEVINVNPLSDASLLFAQKTGVKVIWCTEILRPYSNYMKFDKTEVIKQLQLHTDLIKRVHHTWHIWMAFNPVNRTTFQERETNPNKRRGRLARKSNWWECSPLFSREEN